MAEHIMISPLDDIIEVIEMFKAFYSELIVINMFDIIKL